jgi:hypothetical protein
VELARGLDPLAACSGLALVLVLVVAATLFTRSKCPQADA